MVVAASLGVSWALALAVNRSLRRARGDSMLPAIADGQPLVVAPVRAAPPRAGDVVVARPPAGHPERDGGRDWVKRVAAVGPCTHTLDDLRDVTVPAGHVLLLGDNPSASTDGRHVGPTPLADVTHRVLWPRTDAPPPHLPPG